MQWDREKPAKRQKAQEEALADYVVHHVHAYSPFYRRRFESTKVTAKDVGFKDLAKLPPTEWSEVEADPSSFLLRPTERAIARFGERRLVMAIAKAKLRGKVAQLNRDLIDPAYKPIHWHLEGDVPIGYSAEDLGHLAEAGRRVVQLAEVSRDDVVVNLAPPGPHLPYWQLVDGCRQAGLSAIHLGPGASLPQIERAAPTCLAGPPDVLAATLSAFESAGRHLRGLRTLLCAGASPDDRTREDLRTGGRRVGEGDLEVVAAWAPPGVRALWGECRGGRGFHTFPDLEWIEALPDGEVAWSSLVWHGTTFLRLRTDIRATIEDGDCPTCGRLGPRVLAGAVAAPPTAVRVAREIAPHEEARRPQPEAAPAVDGRERLAVLDEHPAVAAWAAELRRVQGEEELIIFVAPAGVDRLGPLFRELDAELSAVQYIVERPEQVRDRVARHGTVRDLR